MTALLLLADPDQWNTIVAEPGLVHNAVEETLRASRKGGNGIPRYARTDLETDGVTIRAGELVLLDTGAGNHDPTEFAILNGWTSPAEPRAISPSATASLLHRRATGADRTANCVLPTCLSHAGPAARGPRAGVNDATRRADWRAD
jgi:Cytochrome P450